MPCVGMDTNNVCLIVVGICTLNSVVEELMVV